MPQPPFFKDSGPQRAAPLLPLKNKLGWFIVHSRLISHSIVKKQCFQLTRLDLKPLINFLFDLWTSGDCPQGPRALYHPFANLTAQTSYLDVRETLYPISRVWPHAASKIYSLNQGCLWLGNDVGWLVVYYLHPSRSHPHSAPSSCVPLLSSLPPSLVSPPTLRAPSLPLSPSAIVVRSCHLPSILKIAATMGPSVPIDNLDAQRTRDRESYHDVIPP
ncbi:unnamed protein product [Cyclocybe aegerita]|uniref:Uncharacterized protein n=1 Tax=Cyclocybe aegerita TaxID=1973307 RepID=A0A8S0W6M4_CYCAE|nr:unnamed protein product [Cyclocybe aegerita]